MSAASSGPSSGDWRVPPEPTDLICPWPGARLPEPEDVMRSIASEIGAGAALRERLDGGDRGAADGVAWTIAVDLPARPEPVVIWAERGAPGPGSDHGPPREPALGLEAILHEDARADLALLMRVALAASPGAAWIFDVNAGARYERRAIAPRLDELPADLLWSIEVAHAEAFARVATRGLARCGRPELEMVEVAAVLAQAAAVLVDVVAALVVEEGAPPPGAPLEIGPGMTVALQPWEAVAPHVDARAPRGSDADAARRAVVCGAAPRGAYRPIWTWPRDHVERFARGEATVYRMREGEAP